MYAVFIFRMEFCKYLFLGWNFVIKLKTSDEGKGWLATGQTKKNDELSWSIN